MITYGKPHSMRLLVELERVNGRYRCKRYAMVPLENGLHVSSVKLLVLKRAAPKSAVWKLVPYGVECSWETPTRRGRVRIQGYELFDSKWLTSRAQN